jgi:lipopolysaccharide biosynthesis glycosyltransferase
VKTAICLTPDRNFFGPAACVAAQILATGLPSSADIFIICEAQDVWPDYDRLDANLRASIKLLITDFAPLVAHMPPTANGSRAIYRRLVLDRLLPPDYERIVAIDSDIWIAREGLSALATLDIGSHALAAAIDMIFYMDFGGPLAVEFHRHRVSLGLSADTAYFNNGVVVIDRRAWSEEKLGRHALGLISAAPEHLPWFDQDALNILLAGNFAPLSPRYNFMGDFLLLDLEEEIAPIVYHFVNRPKPWEAGFAGDPRFSAMFHQWFARSPWPDFAARPSREWTPSLVNQPFRQKLLADLAKHRFADGWTPCQLP